MGVHKFQAFMTQYGMQLTWPPNLHQLTQFIGWLSLHGLAYNTAKLYITAVGYHCKIKGYVDPTQHFIISKMLEGFRRSKYSGDSRLPMSPTLLQRICGKLPAVCSNNYEVKLFRAAYTLAFFGFMRVGELAWSRGMSYWSVLQLEDINIDRKQNELSIQIRQSKTDQHKEGTIIQLSSNTTAICPVVAMLEFIEVRSAINGPLFCHFDGSVLTRYQFSAILKKTLGLISPHLIKFRSHSFRIGAATTAASVGMDIAQIKLAGRWRSDAVKTYIRTPIKIDTLSLCAN